MANVLQFIKDYGPMASVLFSLIALIAVFVVNSKVGNALKRIIKLKDDTRVEKSKVLVEAFRVINKLKALDMSEYKEFSDELDEVYSRMYSVVTDAKLIQAYHRVVTLFILGGKPSLVEFEALARKELGLTPVVNKNKLPYILMISSEEEKIKARLELEEQKRLEEEALMKQKELLKQKKESEKERKIREKEELKAQKKALKLENLEKTEEVKIEEPILKTNELLEVEPTKVNEEEVVVQIEVEKPKRVKKLKEE